VGGAVNEPPCAGVSAPTLSFLDNISHLTSVGSYRFALKVKASLNARGIE
jgi:hypothetical protein